MYDREGNRIGEIDLMRGLAAESRCLLHQVVRMQLANKRRDVG